MQQVVRKYPNVDKYIEIDKCDSTLLYLHKHINFDNSTTYCIMIEKQLENNEIKHDLAFFDQERNNNLKIFDLNGEKIDKFDIMLTRLVEMGETYQFKDLEHVAQFIKNESSVGSDKYKQVIKQINHDPDIISLEDCDENSHYIAYDPKNKKYRILIKRINLKTTKYVWCYLNEHNNICYIPGMYEYIHANCKDAILFGLIQNFDVYRFDKLSEAIDTIEGIK